MSISYQRESNTLALSSPKLGTEAKVDPFYVQACPLCGELLRAYFPWAEGPLDMASHNRGVPWNQQYRGFRCQGYLGIVQNSHLCPQGWAYPAFTPAQSLLMLLRDRLGYHSQLEEADREELQGAGTRLLAGEPCPEGLVLARELVQGRDAFLALRYEALRGDGQAQPYHLALAHEHRALLALLEPLTPLLTRKMRQEMDL